MGSTLDMTIVSAQLVALIDAREQDLYDEGPADMAALSAYAEGVGGLLSETALLLSSGRSVDGALRARAKKVGSLWAMLGLVRAIPFHWASNRNYVPGDKGRASLATTSADKMFELAEPSINEMISYCEAQLAALTRETVPIPANCRHVFLPAATAKLYMSELKKVGNNPFKMEEPSVLARLWRLWRANMLRQL